MRLKILCFPIFICVGSLIAQTDFATLGKTVNLRINYNGTLGINVDDLSPQSSVTNNDNNHFLRQAGLYIVAQDQNGLYHSAVQRLSSVGSFDFWGGPIDTLTGQTDNSDSWKNVWTVTQDQIKEHRNNLRNPDYQIPTSIAEWPANGNGGFATYLAPFIDANNDGIYDATLGDYPAIKGTKSAYCVFNDKAEEHRASFGLELGIEVQFMAYVLENNDAVYLEYFIINRGINDYPKINIGFFLDGECGNPNDNYAGTLELFPQSVFIYNGDDFDDDHFGNKLPFVSATFLNENLTKSIAFDNTNNVNGTPTTADEFIQLGLGNWKNGQLLQQGGDGVIPTQPANYIFAQSPENGMNWQEIPANSSPGKRTIIGINEHNDFKAKDHIKLDLALNFGTLTSDDNHIQKIASMAKESALDYRLVTSDKEMKKDESFNVYPNPVTTSFFTLTSLHKFDLQIINNQGVMVYKENNLEKGTTRCNINLATGVYYLKLNTQYDLYTKKICVIR